MFHVPDFISIYLTSYTDNEDIEDPQNHKRISFVVGKDTKHKLKNLDFNPNINSFSYNTNQTAYNSSVLNISNNFWYNLTFNFIKNDDQTVSIDVYLDGNLIIENIKLNFIKDVNTIQNSYICLGNKPSYNLGNISSVDIIPEYSSIFYTFFGKKYSDSFPAQTGLGPIFKKDIDFGKQDTYSWSDDNSLKITDYQNLYKFSNSLIPDENLYSLSESFNGEIHDIRIYKESLSQSKILSNCQNIIKNIDEEISDFSLDFYVPVFYIPSYAKKTGIITLNSLSGNTNIYHSCIYNPYFANTCGGLDVTVENYLIDFVNHTKPNVVIGGDNFFNIVSDAKTSIIENISPTTDVLLLKKGELINKIYSNNLDNNESHYSNNLVYRNLLILPNDNGKLNVNFSILKSFLENNDNQTKIDLYNTNLNHVYNINTNDIFNNSLYDNNSNNNQLEIDFTDFNDSTIVIKSSLNNTYNYEIGNDTNLDLAYNISNFIYNDYRITDMSQIYYDEDETNTETIHSRYTEFTGSRYTKTSSNPVTKKYFESLADFNILDIVNLSVDIDNNNNKLRYRSLPIPYSAINKNYDCLFGSIIDISSKMYNNKIKKSSIEIKDNTLLGTNNNISITLKDNESGILYRSDCLSKVADWNYVGHAFYKEGIITINRPELNCFGEKSFKINYNSEFKLYVHEINIPVHKGKHTVSYNSTYDKTLRKDKSSFNADKSFVYITDVNLHDENLNIIGKAKFAHAIPKKLDENLLVRLKMDY